MPCPSMVETTTTSLPAEQEERDGLAIRPHIMGALEGAERPTVQGRQEFSAEAPVGDQSAGRAMDAS
jgi:hypothetical protein